MVGLVVSIILLLSVLLYTDFRKSTASIIYSFVRDSLKQVSYSANYMNDSLKALALQINLDKNIQQLIYYYPEDVAQTETSLTHLANYKYTTPFVYSIYIYDGERDLYFTSNSGHKVSTRENFTDPGMIEIMDNYKNYEILKPIPRSIRESTSNNQEIYVNVYTYIFYDDMYVKDKPLKAVIINVKQEWLDGIIAQMRTDKIHDNFIIDSNGIQLTTNRHYKAMTDLSKEKYVARILAANNSSGFFVEKVNGVKSLVTYVSSDVLNWKFVCITPYQYISSRLAKTTATTILLVSVVFVAGLVGALVLSKKLYRPVDHMAVKMKQLERAYRSNLHAIKQEFLNNLLEVKRFLTLSQIESQLKELEIKLQSGNPLFLVLLKIDHWKEFCNKYNHHDRSLLKYGIMNIASELMSEFFICEAADNGEDNIVLICNVNSDSAKMEPEQLNKMIHNIFESVNKHLQVSLTAVVTPFVGSITDISSLYDMAVEASNYRILYGHKSIIYAEAVQVQDDSSYAYPLNKERQLVDALMLEKEAEVKRLYQEIVEYVKNYSYSIINMTFLRLSLAIGMTVNNFRQNGEYDIDFNINNLSSFINAAETIEEINSIFFNLFDMIFASKNDKKSKKYDELLNNIMNTLYTKYSDPNLSLNTLAEQVNLSPVYLGRLFKRLTGKSVSDQLNEIRIEKAKEFLTNTNLTISEIVENIGFTNNSYFYTVFKKYQGMSPNDYRQKHLTN